MKDLKNMISDLYLAKDYVHSRVSFSLETIDVNDKKIQNKDFPAPCKRSMQLSITTPSILADRQEKMSNMNLYQSKLHVQYAQHCTKYLE